MRIHFLLDLAVRALIWYINQIAKACLCSESTFIKKTALSEVEHVDMCRLCPSDLTKLCSFFHY